MHTQKIDANRLVEIATLAMRSRGLEPHFSESALTELAGISIPATATMEKLPDLTHLLWCSIDNDDSMDLDQITVAEKSSVELTRLFVALADVDALVKKGSPIDQHANKNTTSVYTGVATFPMLPEKLSTNLTSLSEGENRIALLVEMTIDQDGDVKNAHIYRAHVRNQAKLTYNQVGAWLEGNGPLPEAARRIPGLDAQLRMQDQIAQKMRANRHKHGALELETIEPRAVMVDGNVIDLKHEKKNRAQELIEDFMIAANGETTKFLTRAGYPTFRRVVRAPARWARIVEVAAELGEILPPEPDSKALATFLTQRRIADPLRFPDLSLTVVKLLGRGEYFVEMPGEKNVPGHFGLAVRNYSHSTAPNRRFPDLITHRLLKSALQKREASYNADELLLLAVHCTHQENAADKVERQVRKCISALVMSEKIGERFEAIVTGVSEDGVWARVLQPPVEGKIVRGHHDLDVGKKIHVQLLNVNVERGFIDFAQVDNISKS